MTTHKNHYPIPTSPPTFPSINPRPLFPIREPPASLLLYPPVLPSEAQELVAQFNHANSEGGAGGVNEGGKLWKLKDFALSTHVIPAAYPRVAPLLPHPSDLSSLHSDSYSLTKEERKAKIQKITDEMQDLKRRQLIGEFPPDEKEDRVLWSVVNRYYRIRKSPPTGSSKRKSVTLLLLHPNGFHKETWETFLQHLITSLESSSSKDVSVSVDEIWSIEETQHGDAALLNQGKLSATFDWQDHSRDVLNFLTRYLPPRSQALSANLPIHLPRLSDEVERRRKEQGFEDEEGDRTLVAIGHSLGGTTVTLAAITLPRLFTALILVDPTINPPYVSRAKGIYKLALGAIGRRHTWANREEARRLFASTPFFAAWDPEVLDAYVQFGLTPISPGSESVRLKMPGIQEAAIYTEARVSAEVFEKLKDLDPRVALHWVMAGKGGFIAVSEEAMRAVVWRRPVNSTNTQIASEHLIAQQEPKELAREVHTYLERLVSKNVQAQARL